MSTQDFIGQRFSGQVVIVTGGGSGIGAVTAQCFAEEGATVVVAGRTLDKLEKVAAEASGDVRIRQVDVTDRDALEQLIDDVAAEHGALDVLVNNAGTGSPGDVTHTSDDDWRRVRETNPDSVFYGCRAALPHLKASGGCIVNVTSVSGLGGDWDNVAYNAAKGAVVNLTRALAMDHAADGVRVNAVAPLLTVTEMTGGITGNEKVMARFRERFITGVNLPVDGGLGASNGQPRLS